MSAMNKKMNSQIKKPHLKMIPIKDKYYIPDIGMKSRIEKCAKLMMKKKKKK